jgi:hypothetical protein
VFKGGSAPGLSCRDEDPGAPAGAARALVETVLFFFPF